jgi:EpsD family peptidyl-prolyl cis-trans isomerase
MASKALILGLVAAIALTTTACDKIKAKLTGQPTGQVVATVAGDEITSLELRNELSGFSTRDPKQMKQAQDQALQQIIVRMLLAQKAKAQKLDKAPQYTLQIRRGEDMLLAQLYESRLFGKVAPPTLKESENYVVAHPDQFADRRVYVVDQVLTTQGKLKMENLLPLKTLEEVKVYLNNQGVAFEESVAAIDSLTAEPNMLRSIESLPPAEVFIINQNGTLSFSRIASRKSAPLRGDLATGYAEQQLRQIQAQDFVRTQLLGMRRAAESSITYAKGYKLDNPDAGIVPVTGAPGAPAAAPAKK